MLTRRLVPSRITPTRSGDQFLFQQQLPEARRPTSPAVQAPTPRPMLTCGARPAPTAAHLPPSSVKPPSVTAPHLLVATQIALEFRARRPRFRALYCPTKPRGPSPMMLPADFQKSLFLRADRYPIRTTSTSFVWCPTTPTIPMDSPYRRVTLMRMMELGREHGTMPSNKLR